jgi:hypothetical protein
MRVCDIQIDDRVKRHVIKNIFKTILEIYSFHRNINTFDISIQVTAL